MKGILLAKFTSFIRGPWLFLLFTGMSIIFTFIIGNIGHGFDRIAVPVTGDEAIKDSGIGKALEENEVYDFAWREKDALEETVRRGNAEAGIILEEDGYEMIVGIESPNVRLIEQTVAELYAKKYREEAVLRLFAGNEGQEDEFLSDYHEAMENPVFTIENQTFQSADSFIFDRGLHSIFGFTLFFVIFTIFYSVMPILIEKKEGIWDRMILSPLKKWEMYIGNLVYSFIEGYLQILVIFFAFRFLFDMNFHGKFGEILLIMLAYTFTIVSLSIFVTGIVKNTQQFNAALPIVAVSMAMIGGAFWPIEIVQSEFLLALSKINPLTYGMQALNDLVIYHEPFEVVMMPVSILILMGVVFMGVGIHLMEKRHLQ